MVVIIHPGIVKKNKGVKVPAVSLVNALRVCNEVVFDEFSVTAVSSLMNFEFAFNSGSSSGLRTGGGEKIGGAAQPEKHT